jgi:hypothetical protein
MRVFDRTTYDPAVSWARAHESHLSGLFMAGGFGFDYWAFGRIDHPATQAVFVVYLLVAGIAIAAQHGLESRPADRRPSLRVRNTLMFTTQFALGALLSGFCVFYIRSASLFSSWPFLLFMIGVFVGQEVFRQYHSRLVFAALLLFFSLYSYAIMLVPMLVGSIGQWPFLFSGVLALGLFGLYMRALSRLGHDRYRGARLQIAAGVAMITLVINAFYFLKVFPPLPLVLTDTGIYHDVRRVKGEYHALAEEEPAAWRALFGTNPVLHPQSRARIYAYSAVFAPHGLSTRIVHEWQWQDGEGAWNTQQRVPVVIAGGRDGGFRFYTFRTRPRAGQWRVNILSDDGRAMGRIRFSVEPQAVPPATSLKVLAPGD